MKHVVLCGVPRPTKSMRENCTKKALPESFKGASLKRKGGTFWQKFMPDSAVITPQPGLL